MHRTLLIIDPQNDFCHPDWGSLYVPGADQDIERLAAFVTQNQHSIDQIIVSLDSHQRMDISHPLWWVDANGKHPKPFTSFGANEVKMGAWRTATVEEHARSIQYLEHLDTGKRYPHVVWPEHCLIGHQGHNVWPSVHEALGNWEAIHQTRVHYVTKGENPRTEHFSAIRAEVIDPEDPTTAPQTDLIQRLVDTDHLLIAGEARSHCVANTVRDLIAIHPGIAHKSTLLSDTTSDVPGFETLGQQFVSELKTAGMAVETTQTFVS